MPAKLICTYRIQLNKDFTFRQAIEILPYLAALGVSHVYTSPYLQAATGSMHGYDVVDPSKVNEELGGAEAHAEFCRALESAGLSHVIDIVPNHMAIAGQQNPWWWDVLENGPSSRYALFFDVDWEASEERWPNKVLLPVLGDHYGRILESGQLQLARDGGSFTIKYHEHQFPVDPSSLADVLSRAADAMGSELLGFLADSYSRLPHPTATTRQAVDRRHRNKAVLANLLQRFCFEDSKCACAIESEVARINNDPNVFDAFIEKQNYRLAYWRTAARDLGYRRFFDIKDLAGLRVEEEEVFRLSHELPVSWTKQGIVQGIRVDHPDGLRDPEQYFKRLRAECPETWLLAEKILEPGERLPESWPISGTTGYDAMNVIGGIFVDADSERQMTRLYQDFTGEEVDFEKVAHDSKRLILTELLGSELNRLTSLFIGICERHRRHRDYSRHELQESLRELAACLPVYRTYVRAQQKEVSDTDRKFIEMAVDEAKHLRPDLDPQLFNFLSDILLLRVEGSLESELVMRFQQLTGSAMAKGVEDTAFYRHHRLTCLNEVGGSPGRFGNSVAAFHERFVESQSKWPHGMLATSTHDTKRSEDVRTRLAVLSEIPGLWSRTVHRWSRMNRKHRFGESIDRNTEYLLYQTLLGSWPIELPRVLAYMEKAIREAKLHTSWTNQNANYEERIRLFVQAIMQDEEFMRELEKFASTLIIPGRINSLSQTLIKLTAPGVPDIYQGTDLWDLSLVDPDNRRPVDFRQRQSLLEDIDDMSVEDILRDIDSGIPKLYLIRKVLHYRQQDPSVFDATGSYQPINVMGRRSDFVVAFMRKDTAVTLVPRLTLRIGNKWSDTRIELPKGAWRNHLTDENLLGNVFRVEQLLSRFPVAFLVREDVGNA